MHTEESIIDLVCPNCGNRIIIKQVWYPGGINDYGSFVLECDKCQKTIKFHIGRDVDASSVISGAKLINKTYED